MLFRSRSLEGYSNEEIIDSINAKGRDNARHPMQWEEKENAGFTTGTPWLKLGNAEKINVKKALSDENSLFYTYQKLITLRKNLSIITEGTYQSIDTNNPQVLSYVRQLGQETLLVVVNFSEKEQRYTIDPDLHIKEILIHNYDQKISNSLSPYEAFAGIVKT